MMIEENMENVEIKRYETLNSAQLCIIHKLYNNSFDLLKISIFNFDKKLLENEYKKIYFLAEINNEVIGYLIIVNNSIVLLKESDEMASRCNGANSIEEGWGNYYYGEDNEGIIAVKDNKVIGGALIIKSVLFDMSLKDTGSFGVIWALPEYEKKGIGIKLYQKGLFELKNKGYKFCHIYYTYKPLDLWYGKLGAKKIY